MKLSKITQKLNIKVLKAIETITIQANEELMGFVNIEHFVQFDLFPRSLLLTCHFENQMALDQVKHAEVIFQKKLHKILLKQGIVLKNPCQNLVFSL